MNFLSVCHSPTALWLLLSISHDTWVLGTPTEYSGTGRSLRFLVQTPGLTRIHFTERGFGGRQADCGFGLGRTAFEVPEEVEKYLEVA